MKRNNNIAPFFIILIVFTIFVTIMKSNNFMLLFLLPFITPVFIVLFIYKILKNNNPRTNSRYGSYNNYSDNNDLASIIKNAFKKHEEDEDSNLIQDSEQNAYSYQDKPEEDYCEGSERSYQLVKKEEPIEITSVLDDSHESFETRLNKLSNEMDKTGSYNLSSKDEMKKAVIYSEILNKKY